MTEMEMELMVSHVLQQKAQWNILSNRFLTMWIHAIISIYPLFNTYDAWVTLKIVGCQDIMVRIWIMHDYLNFLKSPVKPTTDKVSQDYLNDCPNPETS